MKLLKTVFPTSGSFKEPVWKYTLQNDHGMAVDAITYGCLITDVRVPDRNGFVESVVLGFDDLADYEANAGMCLGSVVGRIAGRIDHAQFELDGETYHVPANEGENSLHANHEFANANWDAAPFETDNSVGVIFSYVSPDGSNGFPGQVSTRVTYLLDNKNNFHIHYDAVSNKKTVLNLTNHTYFNLSGNLKNNVLDHVVTANVDRYIELRPDCIPTGKLIPVDGTPFDLRDGKAIREGAESDYPQNVLVHGGYDHPFIFAESAVKKNTLQLEDPTSGRVLTVTTDYPCFVMYSGNYMDNTVTMRGKKTEPHFGVALETQKYPDAMNKPNFESVVLEAKEAYNQYTTWNFSIK